MPVTQAWRDELEKKTQDAILRAMGHPVQPRVGSVDSQTGLRREKMFDHLQDEKVVETWGLKKGTELTIATCPGQFCPIKFCHLSDQNFHM